MDRIRFREVSNAQTGNCGSISAGERKNRLKLGTSSADSVRNANSSAGTFKYQIRIVRDPIRSAHKERSHFRFASKDGESARRGFPEVSRIAGCNFAIFDPIAIAISNETWLLRARDRIFRFSDSPRQKGQMHAEDK